MLKFILYYIFWSFLTVFIIFYNKGKGIDILFPLTNNSINVYAFGIMHFLIFLFIYLLVLKKFKINKYKQELLIFIGFGLSFYFFTNLLILLLNIT